MNFESHLALYNQENEALLTAVFVIGVTIILVFGVFLVRFDRKVRSLQCLIIGGENNSDQDRRQLQAANGILRSDEEERRRVAKELHDGLGGALSGIKITLSNMKDRMAIDGDDLLLLERSIDMLNNAIRELRQVANHMMPESLIKFGLASALSDLCTQLNTMKVSTARFQLIGEERRFDFSHEIILYRIVYDLVSHIFQNNGSRNILVQILYEKTVLSCTIEDDGTRSDRSSFETQITKEWMDIRSRVEYLNGTIDINSSTEDGMSVYISVGI